MNSKFVFSAISALVVSAAFAETPTISNVTMAQSEATREVTIGYTLANGPAVITLDITTNGVSIGGAHLRTFSSDSDVFKTVSADGAHTITWRPDIDCPFGALPEEGAKAVVTAWPLTNTPDYMVVDICTNAVPGSQRYYPTADYLPGGLLDNWEYRVSKLVMRKIMAKGVTFKMGVYRGDDASKRTIESDWSSANAEEHEVTLDHNYYMGVFPMTQGQLKMIYSDKDSFCFHFANAAYAPMRPADGINYNHIRCSGDIGNSYAGGTSTYWWPNNPNPNSLVGRLRTRSGLDFDLPGEAQWEWAARAGVGPGYWNNGKPMTRYEKDPNFPGRCAFNGGLINGSTAPEANCATNNGTQIVGCYEPNAWGLYDTLGNVAELCQDWYDADISGCNGAINVNPNNAAQNFAGTAKTDQSKRVARGGSYYNREQYNCPSSRTAFMMWDANEQKGFRAYCRGGLE